MSGRSLHEAAEVALQQLRESLQKATIEIDQRRQEEDKDAIALGKANQKLLALDGTLAAKDRPSSNWQAPEHTMAKQDDDDPQAIFGNL